MNSFRLQRVAQHLRATRTRVTEQIRKLEDTATNSVWAISPSPYLFIDLTKKKKSTVDRLPYQTQKGMPQDLQPKKMKLKCCGIR